MAKLTKSLIQDIICLTRQSVGECRSPVPANFILSYQEIAVPKLYQRAGRLFLMFSMSIYVSQYRHQRNDESKKVIP